jgi:hypothetical protein
MRSFHSRRSPLAPSQLEIIIAGLRGERVQHAPEHKQYVDDVLRSLAARVDDAQQRIVERAIEARR